jgi:hypothetical protein
MRKFAAGVVVGGLVTIALVPGLATSTPEREQATGATPIERRVAALERRAEAQARINRLVQAQVSNLGSRIDLLREDHPRVYDFSGTPIVVEPRTWRTGFASCVLGGTATGGGFDSNRSVEVTVSKRSLGGGWEIAVWNPYIDASAVVSPKVVCLDD